MQALWDVLIWILFPVAYWVICRIHTWWTTDDIPNTQYFCPAIEDRVPLNEYGEVSIVWKDGESAYGYECTVCGSVHVYDLGIAPAPIYTGDKLKFEITSEGMVQAELDAD